MRNFKHPKNFVIILGILLLFNAFAIVLIAFSTSGASYSNSLIPYFFGCLFLGVITILLGRNMEKIKYAYQFLIGLTVIWFGLLLFTLYCGSPYSFWDTMMIYHIDMLSEIPIFFGALIFVIFLIVYFTICYFNFKKNDQKETQ